MWIILVSFECCGSFFIHVVVQVRVVVSVGQVELELHRHVEGMQGTTPLARFTVGGLARRAANFWCA